MGESIVQVEIDTSFLEEIGIEKDAGRALLAHFLEGLEMETALVKETESGFLLNLSAPTSKEEVAEELKHMFFRAFTVKVFEL